ncbi:hypothetical protein A9Q90_07545 [Gammaproteobacteria bacterium 54_18_T64]|nr:hypothetical protein A9Q90_07545 [Gammaproteobacteria bacterium 54_18_T64]
MGIGLVSINRIANASCVTGRSKAFEFCINNIFQDALFQTEISLLGYKAPIHIFQRFESFNIG